MSRSSNWREKEEKREGSAAKRSRRWREEVAVWWAVRAAQEAVDSTPVMVVLGCVWREVQVRYRGDGGRVL